MRTGVFICSDIPPNPVTLTVLTMRWISRIFTALWHSIKRSRSLPAMQQTLILLKPDCVQRRLIGDITQRFERKGLRLAGLKFLKADRALAEQHYAVHKGKPFYESLLAFLT